MEQRDGVQGAQRELEAGVLKTGLCTGCGACVNLCPYQASYRDRIITLHHCDLTQGRCFAVCPRTPFDATALQNHHQAGADWTPELGPVRGLFITRAADAGIRSGAQHGGTVTALIALALSEGLLDAAVLAEGQAELLSGGVTVRTAAETLCRSGSRFVVSPAVAEFNRAVQTEAQRIGVVATPCQALALARMKALPVAEVTGGGEKLRLVIGLFCGWALAWQPLAALLKQRIDPQTITGMDIPPSRYHTLEVYSGGGTIRVSLDEVTPCVREACRFCDDMTAEYADLSVGSARLPAGWEEARGWNQVLVRTERGRELLDLARRRGVLEFHDLPDGNLEKLKEASRGKKRAAEAAAEERRRQSAATMA